MKKKITLVVQYDDQALYIDGLLHCSGNQIVNGACDVLKALDIPFESRSIHYDIWAGQSDGWPEKLTDIDELI